MKKFFAVSLIASSFILGFAPVTNAEPSSRPFDLFLKLAFDLAAQNDFDSALINYLRAMDAAETTCDREFAQAGIDASLAAKSADKYDGTQWEGQDRFSAYNTTLHRRWAEMQPGCFV